MAMRGTSPQRHYLRIPVVNLLPEGHRSSLRVFGAEGTDLWIRAALVVVSLAAAALLLVFDGQDQSNLDARAASIRQATAADNAIVEAQELEFEIGELRAVEDVSGRDFRFLLSDPQLVVGTIRSVFDLAVPGVVVTYVELLGPDTVAVEIEVVSNDAAFEWLRLIPSSPGVQRILSFDPLAGEGPLTYATTLVAGGAR